ncbi:unnamed protein product [Dimorphilus gyrociliatus]|uniref:Uncharacterized protein n=1 Tax=Dimorphilus gyrociliatus TaxID=2664684 RepID=A0A7I8WCQ0_9ANNE|nr:unnamed protein product [Dimorphilus gyrociliatus]
METHKKQISSFFTIPEPDSRPFKEKISEFCSTSTMHGLKIVGCHTTHIVRRILWLIAVTACFLFILTMLIVLMIKVHNPGTQTDISINTLEVGEGLQLPAITICSYNQYTLEYLKTAEGIRNWLFLSKLYPDIIPYTDFENLTGLEFNVSSYRENISNVLEVIRDASFNLTSSLKACSWNGQIQQCSSLPGTRTVFTDFGVCYSINYSNDSSYIIKVPGARQGIMIFAFDSFESYIFGENFGSLGFRILVHDPFEYPSVKQFGISVQPSIDTTIALKKNIYQFREGNGCQKRVPQLIGYKRYTENGCMAECVANCVYHKCSCKLFFQSGDYLICNSPESVQCARRSEKLCWTRRDYLQSCNCPLECEHIEYENRISIANYPSLSYKNLFSVLIPNTSLSELSRNAIKMTIYYEDLNVVTFIQSDSYTAEQIFGDIGGQMGLFLGASVLTIAEFCDFIIFALIDKIRCYFKSKKIVNIFQMS